MDIYNDDCFKIFPKIEDTSINLFLLDLPYANKKFGNCTACAWDTPIDLEKMWVEIKRTMKPNGIIVFFCNTKFGYSLINSNPKWFKYDLIWEKSRKVGFLSANKQPLRKHENIYIFKKEQGEYTPQKTIGKPYKTVGNGSCELYSGQKRIDGENKGDRHPTSILPEFKETHENIYIFKDKVGTYNPQKTEGKPYKTKEHDEEMKIYNNCSQMKRTPTDNKGDRHPTSILPEFEETHENIYVFKDKGGTYNPQKTEGKPYKPNRKKETTPIYGKNDLTSDENKGDRHPTSILPEFEETHENIYIFKDKGGTYNPQKTPLDKPYTDKRNRKITNVYGEITQEHSTTHTTSHPTSILPEFEETHENIYIFKDKGGTYNPQKTEREKDYKHSGKRSSEEHYGNVLECKKEYKKEDGMHPTSILPEFETTILKYNNPHKTIHRTQKPVDLLEWLIKTYTNEDDLVMDFCMGSGSAGVACHNTKRKFIGVERDKDIFKLAEKRLEENKNITII